MEKVSVFNKEYKYIKNKDRVKDLKYLVGLLPDYFFEVPASSTGKYHPDFAASKKGLVKHTKVAVRMAYEFFQDESICKFSEEEQDLIIMALVLHDGLKHGETHEKYTRADHPLVVSKFIMEHKDKLNMEVDDIRKLCKMIESHMGPWNTDYKTGEEILPKPRTAIERFVHMCDYLASRKFLDVKFKDDDILS